MFWIGKHFSKRWISFTNGDFGIFFTVHSNNRESSRLVKLPVAGYKRFWTLVWTLFFNSSLRELGDFKCILNVSSVNIKNNQFQHNGIRCSHWFHILERTKIRISKPKSTRLLVSFQRWIQNILWESKILFTIFLNGISL